MRYKVIGPYPINGVEKGGEVDLDPARVNVKALVKAALVEPAKPVEKPAAKAADKK